MMNSVDSYQSENPFLELVVYPTAVAWATRDMQSGTVTWQHVPTGMIATDQVTPEGFWVQGYHLILRLKNGQQIDLDFGESGQAAANQAAAAITSVIAQYGYGG